MAEERTATPVSDPLLLGGFPAAHLTALLLMLKSLPGALDEPTFHKSLGRAVLKEQGCLPGALPGFLPFVPV